MPGDYLTLGGDASVETEVKRSRFLACARRVESEESARQVIEDARSEYWDARHHCSAFVVGARGELTRSNDDGEPAGTAGMPILQAISGRGLSDAVVVVTRYFGGTLLGAGGLSRAYGDAAAVALDAAGVTRRVASLEGYLDVDPATAGKVENLLRSQGFAIQNVEYAATVRLTVSVPRDAERALTTAIAEATQGTARFTVSSEAWVDAPPR